MHKLPLLIAGAAVACILWAEAGAQGIDPGIAAIVNAIKATLISVGPTGSAVPADATYIGIKDSSNHLAGWPTDSSGLPEISPTNLSSSFGAAFPTTGSAIGLTDGTNMQPIHIGQQTSALSVPVVLPSDQAWATSTLQTSGNTSLSSIATNTSNTATSTSSTATNTGTIAGAVTAAVMQSNTKQVNGITTLAGAGATGTGSQRVTVAQDSTTVAGSASIPTGTNSIGTVQPGNTPNTTPWLTNRTTQYPSGATAVTASATGTTGATTATLAAVASNYNFVCGYSIRANATAVITVADTLTGILGGTATHELWVPPNTSGLGVDEQIFTPCIPSSAVNTAIAAVSGAPGTGGVVSVFIWGYYKATTP